MAHSFHVSLSVRGALLWGNKETRKALSWLTKDGGERYGSTHELKAALMELLSQGVEQIQGVSCDSFDPKTGCKGHQSEIEL